MTIRLRSMQSVLLGLILAHLTAAFVAPASFWGLAHLAVFPAPLAATWSLVCIACVLLAPRLGQRARSITFPGSRWILLTAALSVLPFWFLREQTHFFGDGDLLIRDRGISETVGRAPLLVTATARLLAASEGIGLDAEATFAGLSVAAGMLAVALLLRLAASLTELAAGRFLIATVLATAGCMQLFFGHVEYYAVVAAAVLAYLLLASTTLRSRRVQWASLPAFAVLLPLHLSSLGLVPAQLYLTWRSWRAGKRPTLLAAAAAGALFWVVPRLAGGRAESLAATSVGGIARYLVPFRDDGSARFAFGFFDLQHVLAFFNDVVLSAPLLVVAPLFWMARKRTMDPTQRFLLVASLGCLVFNFAFSRELGAYRDWDILAPYGFVYMAALGTFMLRDLRGQLGPALLMLFAAGAHHTLPWVLMNASEDRALAYHRLVLDHPTQWSAFARAYLHETFAIHHRNQGDEESALREYEAAVNANPADARYRVGLGNRYFQRGEYERAAQEFAAAVRQRPEYAIGHNNLAFCLAQLNRDLDRARGHAESALQLQPANADFWMTLAAIERKAQRPDAARRAAQRALQLRQPFPDAEKFLQELEPEAPR